MTVEALIHSLQQMKPDTPVIIETLDGHRELLGVDAVDGDEWSTTIYTDKTEAEAIHEFDEW
jgi:hypothetical protein